ncbi:MAG TPA: hypothetical protein VGJ19_12330 [Streptosporangiaceae bacterium]
MASVTMDRVAAVQADILDAILKTSADSKLPVPEQDRLLAQSCTEACDLLRDWLVSGWFERTRPKSDRSLAATVPTPDQFAEFLGPVFTDALQRIGRYGIDIDLAQLEQARAGVAALAQRHRGSTRNQLFYTAQTRVAGLRDEVCKAAARIQKSPTAYRHRTQRELKKVAAFMPAVALTLGGAMLGVGPHQMEQSVSAWAHDAAQVVVAYQLAELAQPGIAISLPTAHISPPSAGLKADAEPEPEAEPDAEPEAEPEAEAGF